MTPLLTQRSGQARCEPTDLWALVRQWTPIGILACLLALDVALGVHKVVQPLYLIPVWMAYRNGGPRASIQVLGLALVLACIVNAIAHPFWAAAMSLVALLLFVFGHLGASNIHTTPAAVMVDCDGVLALSERYGDAAGEHIIRMLERAIRNETRAGDEVNRLGSKSFVVVLTGGSDQDAAKHVMNRVKRRFRVMVEDAGYECTIRFASSTPDAPKPIPFNPRQLFLN